MFLILIQEIKKDIICRHMNLPPSTQQVTSLQHLTDHLEYILCRLGSYFQYIGLSKYAKAISALQSLQEINFS
jgi:hypothetical protein